MESAEFRAEARDIINAFKGRLPGNTVMTLEVTLAGGELSIALKELVFALANNGMTITRGEFQKLTELIDHLEDDGLRARLDGIAMDNG